MMKIRSKCHQLPLLCLWLFKTPKLRYLTILFTATIYSFLLQESAKRNPIYLFYESVSKNAAGLPGNPGDKHYKCFHGNCKILTIMRAMRSSFNGNSDPCLPSTCQGTKLQPGLTGHLKTHFPAMYRLFLLLKDRNEPPTDEEKAIASGMKILDPAKATEYLARLEKASTNVVDIFTQQHQRAAVHHIP